MTDTARSSLLRLEVGRLRAETSRRRFDPVVHVGMLGEAYRACRVPALDPVVDAGTRTEVVLRLLEEDAEHTAACLWLARPGEPRLEDADLAWLAAAVRAFGVVGRQLEGAWAVTRTGWLDLRTGERRTWKRLRIA
jgi:hypothetical protein